MAEPLYSLFPQIQPLDDILSQARTEFMYEPELNSITVFNKSIEHPRSFTNIKRVKVYHFNDGVFFILESHTSSIITKPNLEPLSHKYRYLYEAKTSIEPKNKKKYFTELSNFYKKELETPQKSETDTTQSDSYAIEFPISNTLAISEFCFSDNKNKLASQEDFRYRIHGTIKGRDTTFAIKPFVSKTVRNLLLTMLAISMAFGTPKAINKITRSFEKSVYPRLQSMYLKINTKKGNNYEK